MKMRILCLALALIVTGQLRAEPPTARNLPSLMPAPDWALQHTEALGITPTQRTRIEDGVRDLETQAQKLSAQARQESDVLAELLSREIPDAAAVATQFDKVLTLEDDVKRVRLKMSLQVRTVLTPEQQKKLGTLQNRGTRGNPVPSEQQELAAKMERVKELIERSKNEGRDLSPMREMWKRVSQLTHDGKTAEASRLLEETAASLEASLNTPPPKK